jgi:predicted transcriptional regulator
MVSKEGKLQTLVPLDPKTIRASDLYEKAKEKGIGQMTASKHLKNLCARGVVKRIQKSPKEVYYQQVNRSIEERATELKKYENDIKRRHQILMDLLDLKGEELIILKKDSSLTVVHASPKLIDAVNEELVEGMKRIKK